MSRADFWHLSGMLTLNYSASLTPSRFVILPQFPTWYYGRKDCDDSPSATVMTKLPNGHDGFNITVTFFKEAFNFSLRDTILIIG